MKEFKNYRILMLTVLLCFMSISPGLLGAQSAFLDTGENGVLLQSETSLNTRMDLRNTFLRTAYSISGILDIGLLTGLTFESINETPSTAVNIELYIQTLILKQSVSIPFSLQLRGGYGYTRFVDSEYLEKSYLRRIGKGYEVAIAFLKEINLSRSFNLHLEVAGGARSYYYLTELTIPGDYDFSIGEDRNRTFARAVLSLPFTLASGAMFIPGVKAEYDLNGFLTFGPVISLLTR